MKKFFASAVALTAAAVALPVGGVATAKERPATKALTAKLTGAAEVPERGDPNGKGTAVIRINQRRGTVCFNISMKRIAGSAAAHIHEAPAGEAGPVRVTLFGDQSSKRLRKGCVRNVPRELVRDIAANPRDYYVNVHNADYPAGAIRGQLRGKSRR
jgi:hypothetical protein